MPSRCRWSVSSWRKEAASSCHGKGILSLTPRCGLPATTDRSGSLSGPLDILAPERTHQTIGTILLQAALDLERRAISRLCLSPTPMIHSNQPKLSPAHLSGEGTPCTPITPVFKRLARRLRTDSDRCLYARFSGRSRFFPNGWPVLGLPGCERGSQDCDRPIRVVPA